MSNKKKLDPRTVRADGRGMTKEQRAARESELADQLFASFTAMTETVAMDHARKAEALEKGLSAASVVRAKKKAKDWSRGFPPGYIEAKGAMDTFEDICADYGVSASDVDELWSAIAQLCLFQLAAKRGPFHQIAREVGIAIGDPRGHAVPGPIVIDFVARDANVVCDCANCRPRKESELN
jgi:hypothetical protein